MSYETYVHRLQEDRATAVAEMRRVVDTASREGRDLAGDETEKLNRVDAEIDRLGEQIRHFETVDRREREVSTSTDLYRRAARPDGPDRTAGDDELRAFLRGERRVVDIGFSGLSRHVDKRGAVTVEGRDLLTSMSGAPVPTSMEARLYSYLTEASAIWQLRTTQLQTAGGENLVIPTSTNAGTAAIRGEGSALPESDPAFAQVTLGAWKYGQLLQVSRELLEDSTGDLLGFIGPTMATALDAGYGPDFATGTGTNEPVGIFKSGVWAGTVVGGTGVAGSVQYADLIDTLHTVTSRYRRNGQWLMHDDSVAGIRKLVDTTSRPLWEPSLVPGQPDSLLGYPVVTDPSCNAAGTNVLSVAFGDFSGYYVRQAGGLRFERSDDYAFNVDLVTFRCVIRLDGDIIDPNAVAHFKGGTA